MEQRRGKKVVSDQTTKKENKLNTIESILSETAKQLKKVNKDFYDITDRQREKINLLTIDINNKLNVIDKYNKIELIDKEKENLKIKSLLNDKRKELSDVSRQIDQIRKEAIEFEKYRTTESQKLNEVREYQENVKKSLQKKQSDLNRKEKRLNKIALEYKNIKNG